MKDAVVLKEFMYKGVKRYKGEELTLSQSDYDEFYEAGWVGPTGDDHAGNG